MKFIGIKHHPLVGAAPGAAGAAISTGPGVRTGAFPALGALECFLALAKAELSPQGQVRVPCEAKKERPERPRA